MPIERDTQPLVTLAVVAYNQEPYVEAALEGAFAQDYVNLEILVSDDASTDATYDRIVAKCAGYTGPHMVRMRREKANVGLGRHVSEVTRLAKGGLVVVAAGDDVSLPNRCSRVVQEWLARGRPVGSVYSAFEAMDAEGRVLGRDSRPMPRSLEEALERPQIGVTGATHAWSRELFEIFGPLDHAIVYEDRAIQFRSMMRDGAFFIDEPLVRYRISDFSVSRYKATGFGDAMERAALNHRRMAQVYAGFLVDLAKAEALGLVAPGRARSLAALAERQMRLSEVKAQFLSGGTRKRLGMIASAKVGLGQRVRWLLIVIVPSLFHRKLPGR